MVCGEPKACAPQQTNLPSPHIRHLGLISVLALCYKSLGLGFQLRNWVSKRFSTTGLRLTSLTLALTQISLLHRLPYTLLFCLFISLCSIILLEEHDGISLIRATLNSIPTSYISFITIFHLPFQPKL